MKCECESCRRPGNFEKVCKTAETVSDMLGDVLQSYLQSEKIDEQGSVDTATANGVIYGIINFAGSTLFHVYKQQDYLSEKEFIDTMLDRFKDVFRITDQMEKLSRIPKEKYN